MLSPDGGHALRRTWPRNQLKFWRSTAHRGLTHSGPIIPTPVGPHSRSGDRRRGLYNDHDRRLPEFAGSAARATGFAPMTGFGYAWNSAWPVAGPRCAGTDPQRSLFRRAVTHAAASARLIRAWDHQSKRLPPHPLSRSEPEAIGPQLTRLRVPPPANVAATVLARLSERPVRSRGPSGRPACRMRFCAAGIGSRRAKPSPRYF